MSHADDQFIAAFMNDYFAECEEHLTALRGLLLSLEQAVGQEAVDPAILEEMFRGFHSIKGISGMVELREAETLAHEMESYLRALRERETPLTASGVDALVTGVAALEAVVAARRAHRAIPAIDSVTRQIAAVVPQTSSAAAASTAPGTPESGAGWIVTFVPSQVLNERGVNVDAVRKRLRDHGTIVHAAPRILPEGVAFEFGFVGPLDDDTLAAWRPDGITAQPASGSAVGIAAPSGEPMMSAPDPAAVSGAPTHYVRVDLARLDDLMRMIGDLVISRARLEDTLARIQTRVPAIEWRAVHEDTAALERQLRDLREGVVRVRLVRVGEIFRRMPFVVRDLTRESGALVRLTLDGQETEIDKYVVERMMDPVLHLVRNAVTHAFESPAERRASGKPEEGTLLLSAASAGESVIIEIADDGRGIDIEAVVGRARAMGMAVPDGPVDQTTLLDLISAPGFSTRDATDRGSGRGVGMAVVKSTIQQLNGTLSLQTERGGGTRFVIELPLTLSITEAMIASVGDRTFAVPQASVREVVEIDPASLRTVEHYEIAPYRGAAIPVVRLGSIFGIPARRRRALHAFVIGTGIDAVAIAVDRISGQREIVVRAIADPMVKVDGVSGATDLGDGRVVLILHLPALVRLIRQRSGAAAFDRARSG